MIDQPISQRLYPAAGAAVLALTATPWITKDIDVETTQVERSFSFWGLFESVNDKYAAPLALAAAVLVAFVLVAILAAHRTPMTAIVFGWVLALASLLVMLNTDNDFSPAAGAWLTLAVALVTAAIGTVDRILTSARDRVGPAD